MYNQCVNTTNSGVTADSSYEGNSNRDIVTPVAVTLGLLAVLVFAVSTWLIVRRRKLNSKAGRTSELSDDEPNSRRSRHDSIRVMSLTRIDMYGGSLDDLRLHKNNRIKVHLEKTNLQKSLSHNFLHHGDHNNTVLSTLSTTWSIQTLPNPPLPGETLVTRTTINPIYDGPALSSNYTRKNVSNNTLYESVSNLLPHQIPKNCGWKKSRSRDPIYQSVDEFHLKSPKIRNPSRQGTHYERVDHHRGRTFAAAPSPHKPGITC